MALPEYPLMDVEDYLILDRNSKETRYEYFEGELRMQAGGNTYHSRIIANLTGVLYGLLIDTPCQIYNSDIRLQLSESRYVYPDVTVSCDPRDDALDDMIQHPSLIVEVLSPGTEAIDRGRKFFYYRDCPTIQEYVMVDTRRILVEVYRREADGWMLHTFGPDSSIKLESLELEFSTNTIYRGLKLTETRNDRKS